ncbi:WD40 domain-containing protein [bacterium]|nr:WD40 domain-containing protein [bacterium]MCI0604734.1 WD40 domain-containing protein [bacterium]
MRPSKFHWIALFLLIGTLLEAADTRPELVLQTGHTGSILTLTISPDGRWLVSGGQDSTVKMERSQQIFLQGIFSEGACIWTGWFLVGNEDQKRNQNHRSENWNDPAKFHDWRNRGN